jgi:hypothetical protein
MPEPRTVGWAWGLMKNAKNIDPENTERRDWILQKIFQGIEALFWAVVAGKIYFLSP